ncbi:succinate dehydrogenase, hydrophobic membrane anchor protein [Alphaproteobacteria bacterium]|jgi:succinate dehydrogenase / fumarate reductase, membrane anchor subunit|nr:succinate dehydrogenase, hydrophobic membrane anchor protein [Alphaproteobacteria bacterium]
MSMRTPLSRVRGLGSAKKGTEHFWLQRVTAIANIPLTVFLIATLVVHAGSDYVTMRAFLAQPIVSIVFLLLIASAVWHMRLGLQVVIEDYVSSEGRKLVAIMANNFASIVVAVTCSLAVLKIALN